MTRLCVVCLSLSCGVSLDLSGCSNSLCIFTLPSRFISFQLSKVLSCTLSYDYHIICFYCGERLCLCIFLFILQCAVFDYMTMFFHVMWAFAAVLSYSFSEFHSFNPLYLIVAAAFNATPLQRRSKRRRSRRGHSPPNSP